MHLGMLRVSGMGFLVGKLSFTCHKDSVKFSSVNELHVHMELNSEQSTSYTIAPHTADNEKLESRLEYE